MSQWYAFRVPSQRELTAHDFLTEKRGLKAFVPFEFITRKVRRGKRDKTFEQTKRAMMPGYVLIRTDDPYAIVHRFGIIQSVVSFDGKAARMRPREVVKLMRMSGQAVAKESPPIKLEIGQTIRITNGAGQGLTGKITASKGERASVKLAKPLLGRDVIEVKTGSLEAA